MNPCPSPELLQALLDDRLESSVAENLTDHLGECFVCRDALLRLSVELDDWDSWESMIRAKPIDLPDASTNRKHHGGLHNASPFDETIAQSDAPLTEKAKPTRRVDFCHHRDFGDYELLDKIGTGGMGVVYRVRQKSADRIVALKLIRPEQLDTLSPARRQAWLDRFRSEAQTAARLEHDHVVTIYEVGEFQGMLYYSMQYIEGPSLSQIIREGPIDNHRAAVLMYDVAIAVDHAHRLGILHRDLKPQNILIRQTNVPVGTGASTIDTAKESASRRDVDQERPFVADFGLAKCLEDGTDGTTHTGDVMGSPSYMSPEQAFDSSRCTPLSDVYSLGATLYDALTGRPPFRTASPLQTLRQVVDEEPVAPRSLNPAIARDLETITLKALSKDPARRYNSAAEMAADLQSYIQCKPIRARPASPAERVARWCRRNPAIAFLVGGITATLVMFAIQLRQHAIRESEARREVEKWFVTTMGVVNDFVANYGDESLAHVPHKERERRQLLREALQLYQGLLEEKPTNPELQSAFARTQHQVGLVHDLLGEHDQAVTAYQAAIRSFETLQRYAPEDWQLQQLWADSHTMLGETLRKTEPANAMDHFEQALRTQRNLQKLDSGNPEYRRELSRTLNNLGLLLTESGRFELAEERLHGAIDQLTYAVDHGTLELEGDQRAHVLADLGRAQINLGVLLRTTKARASEAEAAYREAIENLRQAVDLVPDDDDYRFRLSVATLDLGNYLMMETKDGAAAGLVQTGIAADKLQELSTDFPGVPKYRYELANALSSSAVAAAMLGNAPDSEKSFSTAQEVLAGLDKEFPHYAAAEPKYQSLQGRILGGLGFLHSQEGRWLEAQRHAELAIEHQRNAMTLRPENPEFVQFLGQHYGFISQVLSELNLEIQAADAKLQSDELASRAARMKSIAIKK